MKLSIITVNKNNFSGLEKTILSVINQTFIDFEYIVIDGNSTDGSVEIVNKYSSKINYWVSEPDTGIYNAMNKGIRKAQGDYCLFLNSGDYLVYPWTLEEAFNEIKIYKQADVYFSDAIEDNHNVIIPPSNITLNFLIHYMINHQNTLIRRELFNHQLFNEKYIIIADWYFFISELIQHNISFFKIKTNIAVFDANGISRTHEKKREQERITALKELKISNGLLNLMFNLYIKIRKIIKCVLPYGIYRLYNKRKQDYKA
jgi:glycosyltransferase involved in cell wall biosynthesis